MMVEVRPITVLCVAPLLLGGDLFQRRTTSELRTADEIMEKSLIEQSKTFPFIALWFQWNEIYLSELSVHHNLGFGYRAGVFYPNGARKGQHHDDWPAFFDAMAVQGLPYTSIHALFCHQHYASCRVFMDSGGANFVFP
jgi:hypothetical protein